MAQNPSKLRAPLPEIVGPSSAPAIMALVKAADENQRVTVNGVVCIPEVVSVSKEGVEPGPFEYRIRFIRADAFEWSDE